MITEILKIILILAIVLSFLFIGTLLVFETLNLFTSREYKSLRQKIKEVKEEHKLNEELERLGLCNIQSDMFDLKCKVARIIDTDEHLLNRILDLEIKTKGKK